MHHLSTALSSLQQCSDVCACVCQGDPDAAMRGETYSTLRSLSLFVCARVRPHTHVCRLVLRVCTGAHRCMHARGCALAAVHRWDMTMAAPGRPMPPTPGHYVLWPAPATPPTPTWGREQGGAHPRPPPVLSQKKRHTHKSVGQRQDVLPFGPAVTYTEDMKSLTRRRPWARGGYSGGGGGCPPPSPPR